MSPQKRKNVGATSSRSQSKRRKVEPSLTRRERDSRIAETVAGVASPSSLSLSFSNVNSPASSTSDLSSPMEERIPDSIVTVPEILNPISGIGSNVNQRQEWVVPQEGANYGQVDQSPRREDNSDQGERVVLDGLIQESVVEVGGQEVVESRQEVPLNPRSRASLIAVSRGGEEAPEASHPGQASLIAAAPEQDQSAQQQPREEGPSPNPAPSVQPISQHEDELDPWIAALNNIAPPAARSGLLSITHNMPVITTYEIDMMEDLKLPDDVSAIEYPRIGNVQLLKLIDENSKIYDGLDLMDGRFVTVRQFDRRKHMRRLRLACRLSLPLGDLEEHRRIYQLLIPAKTTFELFKEKSTDGETKLSYYWIEPPNHGSLHAYVIERKRLPEMQSKEYFRQICQIVEFCHARGVIIRDLKLRKFVFADSRRQTIKLDDLDETAICPENKSDPELIDYDNFDVDDDRLCDRHGCPAYVSPEILDLSRKWYSGRASDVWSLGVLLYVLLVGRYPFYDTTPAGLFTKIRQGRIHLTDQDGVRLEARLLIRNMLRRDPRERPSVTEILGHPWLHPKDYRTSFKVFDSNECVFWKTPTNAPGGSGGATTSGQQITSSTLAQLGGTTPQPLPALARVVQQHVSGGAKMVERINASVNGSRQGGDH